MLGALKDTLRPEFLNRVDEIVVFQRLGEPEIRRIASLLLTEISLRMKQLHIELTFSDNVISMLAEEGYDPTYGARPLKRAAIKCIEEPLANEMLTGAIREGDKLFARIQNGVLVFEKN